MRTPYKSFLIFILLATVFFKTAAQWSTTPDTDNYLNAQKTNPVTGFYACTDGNGGAYYTYVHNDINGSPHVYINRINKNSIVQWGTGIELNTTASQQFNPVVCEDGRGGCYVAYEDNYVLPGSPVLVQHFDSLGNKLWAGNGIRPLTIDGSIGQSAASLVNNNGNGVFVTVQNTVVGGADGIQSQKLNFNGTLQWGSAGKRILLPSYERNPKSVADGSGGIIVIWFSNYLLRAQRLNASGARQYDTANYILTAPGSGLSGGYNLIKDSANRIIITWSADPQTGSQGNIYAQKINIGGGKLWGANGITICDTTGIQQVPNILSDNNGGAYFSWCDSRTTDVSFYAQRVNNSGAKQWQTQGIALYTGGSPYAQNLIVPEINNGAKVFWNALPGGYHVRMQSLNMNGSINAPVEGITIAGTAGVAMPAYNAAVAAPNGEAIVFLEKYAGVYDLYAKKVPQGCNTNAVIKTITTTCSPNSATLTWQGHLFSTFELRYQVNGAGSWTTIGNVGRVTTYTINNLLPATQYKFQLRAKCDLNNSYSAWKTKNKTTQNCFALIPTAEANALSKAEAASFKVYPNPANKNCIINFNGNDKGYLKIFDANGVLKYQSTLIGKQQPHIMDLSAFAAGTYICRLETEGKVFTQKLAVIK